MKKVGMIIILSFLIMELAACGKNCHTTEEGSNAAKVFGHDRVGTVKTGAVEPKTDLSNRNDSMETISNNSQNSADAGNPERKADEAVASKNVAGVSGESVTTGEAADKTTEETAADKKTKEAAAEKTTEETTSEETTSKETTTEETTTETATEEVPEEPAEDEERELSEQEIKKLQWSLRSSDNGFFACQYYRPEEIDWQQVFYQGAGMNVALNEGQLEIIRENLREEIRRQRAEEEELWELYLYTNELYVETEEEEEEEPQEEVIEVNLSAADVTTLTLRSIQNFVKNRTGLDYSEARKPLNWPQLTKNVFYFVREGNNRVQVKLISGTVKGNLYHLYYRLGNKRGATEPEYEMCVEIDGNQWKFISNVSLKKTRPITLLNIDYYASGEMARLQGCKEMISTVEVVDDSQKQQEEYLNGQGTGGKKNKKTATSSVEPSPYWAVITATEDDTRICVEKAYLDDDISADLAREGYFIPGEKIATVILQKGEKLGIRVKLEDIPKLRIWASCGTYYGEYAFGSENSLNRKTQEGMPMSTYVVGHDLNGEHCGTGYEVKDELLAFLKGTWVYYDSDQGNYTAKLVFDDADKISISVTGLTYELECGKWNRIYADEGKAPDVMTFKTADERTQELINLWYPAIKKKMGDYRIRAIQKDGMQMLFLMPENSGAGCLSYLLPGAAEDADEFVFYRFIGATEWEDITDDKG